jgi:hypothetical protein
VTIIAPWRFAFKSLGEEWVGIVTGTIAALVISAAELLPWGKRWPWLPWLTFLVIWSWTWAWTFVRSWNREHQKVSLLAREFVIPEFDRVRHQASASSITFPSKDAEINFYFEKLGAAGRGISRDFLAELIELWKARRIRAENQRG